VIYKQSGIKLGAEKKIMLESRLRRRMSHLQLASYRQYCDYLFAAGGSAADEMVYLIDVVTTNKTEFFREKVHFEFLISKALPELMAREGDRKDFLVWSAGCSTGEEAYTLAMLLSEYRAAKPSFRFRILATDISTAVLEKAARGVYHVDAIEPVPADLRKKYFMRSRNPADELVRVVPELRAAIEFRRLNLMDTFSGCDTADCIFCRNVVIYFDRPTQEQLFRKLTDKLVGGGYMFLGHSESLHQMQLPLVPVAPALYRKPNGRD
jgi:chemotaxis protein methyltransferase CheR